MYRSFRRNPPCSHPLPFPLPSQVELTRWDRGWYTRALPVFVPAGYSPSINHATAVVGSLGQDTGTSTFSDLHITALASISISSFDGHLDLPDCDPLFEIAAGPGSPLASWISQYNENRTTDIPPPPPPPPSSPPPRGLNTPAPPGPGSE